MVHQLVNNKNKKQKNFDSNKMYGKYVKVKTRYKNINNIYIYIYIYINTYRMFLKHFCNCCNNFVFCITDVSNIYTGVFHSYLLQVSGFM